MPFTVARCSPRRRYVLILLVPMLVLVGMFSAGAEWGERDAIRTRLLSELRESSRGGETHAALPVEPTDTPGIRAYYRSRMGAPAEVRHDTIEITSRGIPVAVHLFSGKEDVRGTVLVVHGYLSYPAEMGSVILEMVSLGYLVIAPALPGHGLSSGEPAGIDDFSDYGAFVADVIDALDRPHIPAPGEDGARSEDGAPGEDGTRREDGARSEDGTRGEDRARRENGPRDEDRVDWEDGAHAEDVDSRVNVGLGPGNGGIRDINRGARDGALPRPLHAVGHSTGATALYEYIREGSPFREDPFQAVVFLAPLVRSAWYRASRLGRFLTRPFVQSVDAGNTADLVSDRMPLSWFDAQVRWNRRARSFSVVTRPVLVIQGESDTVVAWRYNRRFLERAFACLRYELLPDAGHVLHGRDAETRRITLEMLGSYITDYSRSTRCE